MDRDLREISAESARRPARTDWTFTFRDEAAGDLAGGEARVEVEVAGDEVADTRRYVFLPEEWRREDEQRQASLSIGAAASSMVLGLVLVAGAVLAVVRWTRGAFDLRVALAVAGLSLGAAVVAMANNWPNLMSGLSTAQPLPLQVGIGVAGALVGGGLLAVLLGLLAGHAAVLATSETGDRNPALLTAVGFGLGFLGVVALAGTMLDAPLPPWSAYGPASSFVPVLGAALGPVPGYLMLTLVTLLIVTSVNTLTAHWTRRKVVGAAALVLVGGLLAPGSVPADLASWAAACLLGGALLLGAYLWVLRAQPSLVIPAVAALTVPALVAAGLEQAYAGALLGSIAGAAVVSVLAWRWFVHLTPAR